MYKDSVFSVYFKGKERCKTIKKRHGFRNKFIGIKRVLFSELSGKTKGTFMLFCVYKS